MSSNLVRVSKMFTTWRITQVAEGNGLENRQVGNTHARVRIPHSPFLIIAGWSSLVARRLITRRSLVQIQLPQLQFNTMLVPWSSWLGRLPVTQEITSSSLVGTVNGSVAQLVEQWIEAPCVGGSIPSRAISGGLAKRLNATDCKSVPSGS